MVGQRIVPRAWHPLVDLVAEAELARLADSVRGVIASCVAAMPDHEAVHRALLQGAGGRMMRHPCASASQVSSPYAPARCSLLACETPAKKKPRPEPVRAAPAVPLRQLDPLLEDVETAHLQLFLGDHRRRHRPRPRSLAGRAVREHRGRGLRAQRLRHRRGTRLCHARPGARARADDTAFPARRAAGTGPGQQRRLPGVLLSLPQFRQRQALRQLRTIHRRHRAAHGRRVVRRRLFRPGPSRRSSRSASSRTSCTGA